MDSGQLNSLLKRLCKILWEAQVTNPITYVTQLSYLIFLKMLEEMDALINRGMRQRLEIWWGPSQDVMGIVHIRREDVQKQVVDRRTARDVAG